MSDTASKDRTLIHQGRLIAMFRERVSLPDDGHTWFDIVRHPGGAVIAAINDKQQLCLLKQFRHAIGRDIWELPAGCLEPGEAPLVTAQRELEEEAGITAGRWQELGSVVSTPGFCDEELHFFAASEIRAGQLKLDAAEQLEAHWVDLDEVDRMIAANEIVDAKTLALLLRLRLRNAQNEQR